MSPFSSAMYIYKFSLGDTRKPPERFHHGNQISARKRVDSVRGTNGHHIGHCVGNQNDYKDKRKATWEV